MSHQFLGIETALPFGPAAGVINGPNVDAIISATELVLKSPVEFSRWASATYNGGEGNEPKYGQVYYHNELTGQTVNSLGLPSVSIDVMEQVYPELQKRADDRGKVVIPGVSAALGDNPLKVLPEMAERLVAAGAERIEVNYSCPNKITDDGGREAILSFDLETMMEADQDIVQRVGPDIWVIRKIAPLVGERRQLISATAEYFATVAGRVALSFNTIGGQSILTELGEPALNVPGNVGGLSGPATRDVGRSMLSTFRELLPDSVQIDSALGVMDGHEVYERVASGANFTSAVTLYLENEAKGIDLSATGRRVIAEFYAAKELALYSSGE